MSTNALVAVKHKEVIKAVYVHFDGGRVGSILAEHYNTPELAEELVSHGAISALGVRMHPIGPHSFEKPERNTTIFYHRDRGEALKQITYSDKVQSKADLKQEEHGCYNYIYYFNGENWEAV